MNDVAEMKTKATDVPTYLYFSLRIEIPDEIPTINKAIPKTQIIIQSGSNSYQNAPSSV